MTEQHSDPPITGTTLALRVADLPARKPYAFHLRPDAPSRAEIAAELGVGAVRKLDFRGTLAADGRHDWQLTGRLGASVVQSCVITAEPVTTRIDIDVIRRFVRQMPEPQGPEAEIPEDDTLELLGATIDPGAVMIEALAIALPDYPRTPDAALGEARYPPPGTDSIDDARPNPFAALAALKKSPPAGGDD